MNAIKFFFHCKDQPVQKAQTPKFYSDICIEFPFSVAFTVICSDKVTRIC